MIKNIMLSCNTTRKSWEAINHNWNHSWVQADTLGGRKVKCLPKVFLNTVQRPLVAVAALVNLVATPLLLIYDLILNTIHKITGHFVPLDGGCYRYFKAETFEALLVNFEKKIKYNLTYPDPAFDELRVAYHQNKLPNIEVVNDLKAFLETLEKTPVSEKPGENKKAYQKLIRSLRKLSRSAISSKASDKISQQAVLFAERIAKIRYLDVELLDILHKDLAEIQPDLETVDSHKDFLDVISDNFEKLDANPKLKNKGFVTDYFDGEYFGNSPFKLRSFKINPGKECKFTRMSSVTRDTGRSFFTGKTSTVEITPTFKQMIESYKKQGKRHLYVNLMVNFASSEGKRSKAIEALENEYPDSFTAISINKDSFFHHQEKQFSASTMGAQTFISHFEEKLFDSGIYHFGPSIDKKELKAYASKLMHTVHDKVFGGKEVLTKEERLDFIEMTQLLIIRHLIAQLNPESCNISCKHCIDRGASQNFGLHMLEMLVKQDSLTKTDKQYLQTLLFMPAILVANRAPGRKRVERTVSMMKRLMKADCIHDLVGLQTAKYDEPQSLIA